DDSDQLVAGHRAPGARVARLRAVVAHHEVLVLRDGPELTEMDTVRQASFLREVWLFEPHELLRVGSPGPDGPVVFLAHRVARQADHALHERAAFAAFQSGLGRRVEDDDVSTRRRAEAETDTAREHAIARVAEAARARLRAVQRGFHRRRWNAV